MKSARLVTVLLFSFVLTSAAYCPVALAQESVDIGIDGAPASAVAGDLPANTGQGPNGMTTIDIVGGTTNSSARTALAKGNSYQVDLDVVLTEVEFWLSYSGTQTLIFYVFDSPVEFGTYTEIYRDTQTVAGIGAGWYSTGSLSINLMSGMHYIIAVSWDGTLTYFYDTGDSQATSFGAHTHGYAVGTNPLPTTINSTSNDQAIYHQRLTTDFPTPVENSTWGGIKGLYK